MARWNLSIPDKTDRTVRRRVFDLTVREIKDRNAEREQQEILDLIDEEVDAHRPG